VKIAPNIANADAFDWLDAQDPTMRAVVHDFGMNRVRACMAAGVVNPARIRQLLCMLMGARPDHFNARRRGLAGLIDGVLINAGAAVSSSEIIAVIRHSGATIVPTDPSDTAVTASLHALDKVGRVNRETKHRLRLRAALLAMDRQLWSPSADALAPSPSDGV